MKQSSRWAILSGVVLAMLLSSLDQTIVGQNDEEHHPGKLEKVQVRK